MVAETDVRKVKPLGADTHEQGKALPVQPWPRELLALNPLARAEKAITTKPEVLVPWAQDKAGHRVERLPQEGKPELKALWQRGR